MTHGGFWLCPSTFKACASKDYLKPCRFADAAVQADEADEERLAEGRLRQDLEAGDGSCLVVHPTDRKWVTTLVINGISGGNVHL